VLADALGDRRRWKQWSRRGREAVGVQHSWSSCASRSLDAINAAVLVHRRGGASAGLRPPARRRFARRVEWAVASDIDGTLTGDNAAAGSLARWLRARRDAIAFIVATGRQPVDDARRIVDELGFATPDYFITSVGAEIRTGPDARLLDEWRAQLTAAGWDRPAVAAALADVPGLVPQPPPAQGPLKLSFTVAPEASPEIADAVRVTLATRGLVARIEVSGGTNLDVLPPDASKGNAVRHCADLLGVPSSRVVAAGDSGNDATMLSGDGPGILVANHTSELDTLRGRPNVYCSAQPFAAGVLEGLEHHLADTTAVEPREPVAAGVL
jgi:sucrose-phosphate synthase